MSRNENKKLKKFGNIRVSVQSLMPADKEGWLTKQGGSIKNWKKRYFVLKGQKLYYFKTPQDTTLTGRIDVEPSSIIKEEPSKKKGSGMFSIGTAKRVFYMYPVDNPEQMKEWFDAISAAIEKAKRNPEDHQSVENEGEDSRTSGFSPLKVGVGASMSPRVRLTLAREVVSFLKNEDSKVYEFWQIWQESIPDKKDLVSDAIDYHVATSADMSKLTWKVGGPQNTFIQKMVDFFWNVGAPESEIDRLNDVGALINPPKIGSWIDMSSKGGMDGGWYFPVNVNLQRAIEASDEGEAISQFSNWAKENNVTNIIAVGRDMGAAPPRQTELRVELPGNFDEQLNLAQDAWAKFGIPAIPDEASAMLKQSTSNGDIYLSIITSSEGFVRIGILVPKPNQTTVQKLIDICSGKREELQAFESSLSSEGPAFAEYQYLMKGFGYGVYKEGFDVVFHYDVGEETPE